MARKQYFRNSGQKGGFRNKNTQEPNEPQSQFTGEFAKEFEELEKEEIARRKAEGLEEPEEIHEELIDISDEIETAVSFWEKNQKAIIAAFAGLLLLVGLYFVWQFMYKEPKAKEAVNAIYKAEQQFAKDSFALALENPGAGYEGFLDIIENYSGTPTGNLAKYYAGVSYLNLGKYEEAIDYLEDYSPNDAMTPITKYSAIGDAKAELNDMEGAISAYKKAISNGDNSALTPLVMEKLSFLYKSQGNIEDALSLQKDIAKKYPKSQLGRKYNALN